METTTKTSPSRKRFRAGAAAVTAALMVTAMTATASATATGGKLAINGKAATSGKPGGPVSCGPPHVFPLTLCLSPHQYEAAYGVTPLISQGIDGRGETVVMPELANVPTRGVTFTGIHQDLAAFDKRFGLPAAKLRLVNSIAHSKYPWLAGVEEVEDTEIVHAIAPGATLVVVLFPQTVTATPASFTKALTEVVQEGITQHAAVVSISASGGEHDFTRAEVASLNAELEQARAHKVTVVSSSGDTGASSDPHFGGGFVKEVSLPASDPLVLAAGGTSLNFDFKTDSYAGEVAWNSLTDASGGGYSHLFPRPSYQDGVPRAGTTRGVPDVAADANDQTGMALAFPGNGTLGANGTSAATPLWAAIVALADQEAGTHLGFVNPAIYAIARGAEYHRAFHDVVTGDNSVMLPTKVLVGYSAGPGWDPVTGWGSPDAQFLVPLLAHAARG